MGCGAAGGTGGGALRGRALASASCQPRFLAAAFAIASRSSRSATLPSSCRTSIGSGASFGVGRTSSRQGGRATGSTLPTRKRSDCTGRPRARSCVVIASPSIESSCAHVELAARTCSTPRSSLSGRARAAIRDPTAASQSRNGIGAVSISAGAASEDPRWINAPSRSMPPVRRAMRAERSSTTARCSGGARRPRSPSVTDGRCPPRRPATRTPARQRGPSRGVGIPETQALSATAARGTRGERRTMARAPAPRPEIPHRYRRWDSNPQALADSGF